MGGMLVCCGWESVQGAWRAPGNRLLGCLQMPTARSWGGGGGVPSAWEHAAAARPSRLGSEMPRRPLTPELHNSQGTSQISGSSGRHPQTSRRHTAA